MAGCALAMSACKRRATAGVRAEDTTFVGAMAELRAVGANRTLDSAARTAARNAVLQRRGLTPAELEARARALAANPRRAAATWEAVNKRADSLPPPPMPLQLPPITGNAGPPARPGARPLTRAP